MDEFKVFDFHRIFLGEAPLLFLLEIIFRTTIMYGYTILLLRLLGKRSMGQLSSLEVAIIISFGSAIGDPMMGIDVPILHGIVAVTTIALLQIGMERIINENKKIEFVMEGKSDCVVDEGLILVEAIKKNNLSHEDLFRSLRGKDVQHLGQVKKAFFETSGSISVFFYSPEQVKPGLSIIPEELIPKANIFCSPFATGEDSFYSCSKCGNTLNLPGQQILSSCGRCENSQWVKAEVDRQV